MIRHLVHLRFREDVSGAEKQALYDRLRGLSARLDGFLGLESRPNIAAETHLVRGFVDMFWIDFADLAARDAYLADAEHLAIGADIVAALDGGDAGVMVCDIAL